MGSSGGGEGKECEGIRGYHDGLGGIGARVAEEEEQHHSIDGRRWST